MVSFDSFTSSVTSRRVPFGGYILTVSSRPFHVDGFISGFYSAVKFWTVLLRRLHRFDGSSRPFHFSVISAVSFWTAPFCTVTSGQFHLHFRRLYFVDFISAVTCRQFDVSGYVKKIFGWFLFEGNNFEGLLGLFDSEGFILTVIFSRSVPRAARNGRYDPVRGAWGRQGHRGGFCLLWLALRFRGEEGCRSVCCLSC